MYIKLYKKQGITSSLSYINITNQQLGYKRGLPVKTKVIGQLCPGFLLLLLVQNKKQI